MKRHLASRIAATSVLTVAALFNVRPGLAAGNEELEQGIQKLQDAWAQIQYETPEDRRAGEFEALSRDAQALTARFPTRAEPHILEGNALSSWAGARGGMGALDIVKRAKAAYETAIDIDRDALDGAAQSSLGVLYYKVPGWPVAFGDKRKAEELLQQALARNPNGIDPNFFYGEFLFERNNKVDAIPYLEKAVNAPPRPDREVADAARRRDAAALLAKIRS